MEGFKNIVSAGVAVGFSPVVISEVLGSYLAAFGQERIAQATVGFCVDLMFQATVKYWFPPEGQEVTVMESIQGLDYVQASASAVEGLISTQGWQGLVTSVVISCAVDGFSSEGAFHEFSLGQCLQGAGSAVLVGGALELFAIRNKFGGIARSRLASGISRLAEATGSRVGKGWDMYRYLRPGAIRAADVAALFDIDEALAGVAAPRIQQSPALQSLFREGDWWMSVRKMTSSAENRAQLLDDLTGDVNLAAAFKERPELVGAWEVFATSGDEGLRVLKTNISDLEILGNYFGWYPENVELIREGLESAINKRGYLDWVKHVDTDFEDYHFVFRDWEFGPNKLAWSEYFGSLKNSSNFAPFPYEQTIEDLLQSADYSQLSKSEGYAVFSYTTIFYQKKFDRWLREGINPEMTSPIANLLDGALDKMPIVPANVNYYRGVNLSGEDLSSFLARHAEGADVTYEDFTSAANNVADSFLEGSNIRITILPKEGSSGRTIYDFSFGKFQLGTSDEAVFKSGFRFNVESANPLGNDVYEFVFREL